ncbi:hypothetical protein LTR65_006155 [Meristemomyces frigidus]
MDGSEGRVAVVGEELKEVTPGYLPRTLEELRAGTAANDMAEESRQHMPSDEQEEIGPSLEDTLDQMFQAALVETDEQNPPVLASTGQATDVGGEPSSITQMARQAAYPQLLEGNARHVVDNSVWLGGRRQGTHVNDEAVGNHYAQSMLPTGSRNHEYQARRVAALRRELHRMRNGIERVISGLRDLGENVPDHTQASGRLADLGRTLDAIDGTPSREDAERAINSVNALTNRSSTTQSDRALANIQRRVDETRLHLDAARRNRDQAASELDLAEQEFRTSQHRHHQLQREQRTTENYLRLFGTREEMLAQGDQYESPIGSMFTRAQERFRAAEDVRVEERTLRRVLEDENSAGGEEGARRLAELESRQTDVWGVPRPPQMHTQEARLPDPGEVVSEEPRGELEEYYALLRQQDGLQRASRSDVQGSAIAEATPVPSDSDSLGVANDRSQQNMMDAVMAAREEEEATPQRIVERHSSSEVAAELPIAVPTQPLLPTANEEWYADIEHILLHFAEDPERSLAHMITPDHLDTLLSQATERSFSESDRQEMEGFVNNPDLVWASGLPAARLLRLRRASVPPMFLLDRTNVSVETSCHNTEVMAELFCRSAELRRRAPGLNAPEQLRMLYRLQAGERTGADMRKLEDMQADPDTLRWASRLNEMMIDDEHDGFHATRQRSLDAQRRAAAREGDHSRQELDAQRRAARDFAVAAGRTAMRAGPTALLERMANRDEETRAAYDRLRANGYAPEGDLPAERLLRESIYRPLDLTDYNDVASPSASESEVDEDEARGLDAKESGRPEQKTDEEMTVSMECRICYTQLAEIACLPCGHLVMCKWCSEQHSPVMAHDRTRPRRAAGCPVCRKGIRQKVRVFRA